MSEVGVSIYIASYIGTYIMNKLTGPPYVRIYKHR